MLTIHLSDEPLHEYARHVSQTESELEATYLEAIDDLTAHWDDVTRKNAPLSQPSARKNARFNTKDLGRIAIVKGMACYVFDTARAIMALHNTEHINAMVPLVRLSYESAMSLSLLVQSLNQHGVDAFLQEYSRQRAALQSTAMRSPSEIFRDDAPNITGVDGTAFLNTNDNFGRFERVCTDLAPGGVDAYLWYRLMSAYSHPGLGVTDLYFEQSDSPGLPPFHAKANEALPRGVLLFFTSASMLWSARAYSYLTHDRRDRDLLRLIGRRIQVADSLDLSPEYHQRHALNARQTREKLRSGASEPETPVTRGSRRRSRGGRTS